MVTAIELPSMDTPRTSALPGRAQDQLYVAGESAELKALAKRNFAERAWDDAAAVKELADHFEGSAIAS